MVVVASYHQAMAIASSQQQQQQQTWSFPFHTLSYARSFTKHRPPVTLFFQIPRQRVSVVRADSQGKRSSGDSESKEVLEAFFLGKAFAEALTERLGTVVGELLSDVGRWQAEQQRQVRDFQEDVQERARKSRAKALQEARSVESVDGNSVSNNGASSPSRGYDAETGVPLRRPNGVQDLTDL